LEYFISLCSTPAKEDLLYEMIEAGAKSQEYRHVCAFASEELSYWSFLERVDLLPLPEKDEESFRKALPAVLAALGEYISVSSFS
jgi:hypothetical protein